MSIFYNYKTSIFFLILICVSILIGYSHTSADNKSVSTRGTDVREIILGVGDVLDLSVWQNKDFSGSYKIASNGNIFIPHVGEVEADGKSALKLRAQIIEVLKYYIVNPQVKLSVTSYGSRKVYVLGEVKRPGIYQLGGTHTTVVAALTAAGGFTKDANKNKVVHLKKGLDKGDRKVLRMGSYLINKHKRGAHLQNAALDGGDVIYVPSNFMAGVDNFFDHVTKIVSPIVDIERAITLEPVVVDILNGKSIDNKILVIP